MVNRELIKSIFEGWQAYQKTLVDVNPSVEDEHLALRAAPSLRSVGEITAHIFGARKRSFYLLMEEGGDAFRNFGKWDRRGAKTRSSEELRVGIEATWKGMQEAIERWTPQDWDQTWPGEDDNEPEMITRQWVIWHLVEHELNHGGEISITLGANRVPVLEL
ncbi:MAG: DUF664 domain-containing protein [Chloroflexota bacterium]|nr:MAG: DUF664 domain-containing protein [Chloroflexota bacterium]